MRHFAVLGHLNHWAMLGVSIPGGVLIFAATAKWLRCPKLAELLSRMPERDNG